MTIREVIEKIQAYHPEIPNYAQKPDGCDGIKYGNPDVECTGIVSSITATVEVIQKAAELGCNFIYEHEPVFYTHLDPLDWLEGDPVFEAKKALLEEHGIVVFRDHDFAHAHNPDSIFQGVAIELGWQDYIVGDKKRPMLFEIPAIKATDLAAHLKEKMGLTGIRAIGNLDATVKRVFMALHVEGFGDQPQNLPTQRVMEEDPDCVIPLECCDWTLASYIRDAGQLGMNKVMLMPGHLNGESLGNKWAVTWLKELVGDLPVTYVHAGDTYQYL